MRRVLLLEERETLLPSVLPDSAAGSYGTARLVLSVWGVGGGGSLRVYCWSV